MLVILEPLEPPLPYLLDEPNRSDAAVLLDEMDDEEAFLACWPSDPGDSPARLLVEAALGGLFGTAVMVRSPSETLCEGKADAAAAPGVGMAILSFFCLAALCRSITLRFAAASVSAALVEPCNTEGGLGKDTCCV